MITVSAPISKSNFLSPVEFDKRLINIAGSNLASPKIIQEEIIRDDSKGFWGKFKTFFSILFKKIFNKSVSSQEHNNSSTIIKTQALKNNLNPAKPATKATRELILDNQVKTLSKPLTTSSCCSGTTCSIAKPLSNSSNSSSCCAPSYRSRIPRVHQPSSTTINTSASQTPIEVIPMIKSTADLEQGLGLNKGVLDRISKVPDLPAQHSFTAEERANDFFKFLACDSSAAPKQEIN
jgi:hypothetical protein